MLRLAGVRPSRSYVGPFQAWTGLRHDCWGRLVPGSSRTPTAKCFGDGDGRAQPIAFLNHRRPATAGRQASGYQLSLLSLTTRGESEAPLVT